MQNAWSLYAKRESFERLKDAGLRGLEGCPIRVHFRAKSPPELLELQLVAQGQLHPDCLPPDRKPPCAQCSYQALKLPRTYWLDAASLPAELDVLRLTDFPTLIFATDRMVEAVKRLELDGMLFREVEAR